MTVSSRNQKPKAVSLRQPGASMAPPVRALAPPSKRPGKGNSDLQLTEVDFESFGDLTALGDAQRRRAAEAALDSERRPFGAERTSHVEPDPMDDLFDDVVEPPSAPQPQSTRERGSRPGADSSRRPAETGKRERVVAPSNSSRTEPQLDRTSVEFPFAAMNVPRPEPQLDRTSVELPFAAADDVRALFLRAPVESPAGSAQPVGEAPRGPTPSLLARARAAARKRRPPPRARWSRGQIAAIATSVLASTALILLSFRTPPGDPPLNAVASGSRIGLAAKPQALNGPRAQAPQTDETDDEQPDDETAGRPRARQQPRSSARSEGGATKSTVASPTRCELRGSAVRLARSVDPQVPIEARVVNGVLVVGLFTRAGEALGLTWAPGRTQADVRYRVGDPAVTGIVPLSGSELPVFALDHAENLGVLQPRTLASKKRWVVGTDGDNLVANSLEGRSIPLWKRPAGEQFSRADSAAFDVRRHGVAFRSQESSAVVRFGVFDVVSNKRWGFGVLPFTGRDIGRPAVAANSKYAAVAAAVAPVSGEPWRIQTVLLDRESEMLLQVPLAYLPYPRFVDQISPKLSPLGPRNWLLQWTEGEALARKIQLLILDENLQPVGEPRTISQPRVNAGGGQVLGGELPVSIYLSQTVDRYDAWIQPLECR